MRLTQLIPVPFRREITRFIVRRNNREGALYCPICKSAVKEFLPHGTPKRTGILCPICRSKACHRLAFAWFDQNPRVFRKDMLFVHIAPELELAKVLRKKCTHFQMRYRHGDIRDLKNHLDIENIGLDDHSVDILFACHVLNMVPHDMRALQEIYRVLKPGGTAILPVPIHPEVTALIEAVPESCASDRMALCGDPMMYRKYTNESYIERLKKAGLAAQSIRPDSILTPRRSHWSLCEEWLHIAQRQ